MDFQIIKIDFFHEVLLAEPGLRPFPELRNIGIQPDRLRQIEITAEPGQGMHHLMRTRIVRFILDDLVPHKVVISKNLSPQTEHHSLFERALCSFSNPGLPSSANILCL